LCAFYFGNDQQGLAQAVLVVKKSGCGFEGNQALVKNGRQGTGI
jgi:hypothetical protein